MTRKRVTPDNLGPTQRTILQVLSFPSHDAMSVRQLGMSWPSLDESNVRPAITRLGNRGLVDVAGWEGGGQYEARDRRTFRLTNAGWAVVHQLSPLDEDEG